MLLPVAKGLIKPSNCRRHSLVTASINQSLHLDRRWLWRLDIYWNRFGCSGQLCIKQGLVALAHLLMNERDRVTKVARLDG